MKQSTTLAAALCTDALTVCVAAPARAALCAALALIACALAPAANAQTVVFDNGVPSSTNGVFSDIHANQFAAEDFTFTETVTFDTVRWYGIYANSNTPPATDSFRIAFFNTSFGAPNQLARPGETFPVGSPARVDTGLNAGSLDIFVYEAALSTPVTMVAGTYGIEIVNNTTTDPNDNWAWAIASPTGAYFVRNVANGGFTRVTGSGLAYQLVNSTPVVVPESGTLTLLLPTVAGLGIVLAARKRK